MTTLRSIETPMFCLDTSAVISVLNERIASVAERFDTEITRRTTILISTIVIYELRYGIARSARSERNRAVLESFLEFPVSIIAFDADDAAEAGEIRAALAGTGTPIGPYDVLIAAQARRCGAALVTLNRREFERVPGLIVTDWAA
jgi:tRNA(fMet)-specific endonuclease VapC